MEFSREERVEAGRTGEGVIDAALTPTCTVAVSLFLDMGVQVPGSVVTWVEGPELKWRMN